MKLGRWRNSAFQIADHMWLLILWAGTTPVFIWKLGDESFGVWILVNAVVGLGGVMSLGFGEATTRYVALYRGRNQPEKILQIVDTTMALYALIGLLCSVSLYFASPWLAKTTFHLAGDEATQATIALRLAALALMISAYLRNYEAVIHGFERYDITARLGMVARSFIILGNLALVLMGFGLVALIACSVIGLFGQAIASFILARRFVPDIGVFSRANWGTAKEIAGFGFQSWLQICGGALNTVVDRFLVSALLDPAAAGIYAICMQLTQQINLLLLRGLAFLMPETSSGDGSVLFILKGYRGGALLVLALSGAIALPMIVLAEQILMVWVGENFAKQGAQTLRVMASYFALLSCFVPMFFLINGSGRPGWNTTANLTHGFVGLGLAALLLPEFGLVGAALGRVIALPAFVFVLWALHKFVLAGRGAHITISMMVWMAVLGGTAWGLQALISDALPATVLVVFGGGLALAIFGGALSLVPLIWLRRSEKV